MSLTKILSAKNMDESDGSDEQEIDRMMMLLETFGNRLDKIETEQSISSPVPAPPTRTESIFAGPSKPRKGFDNVIPGCGTDAASWKRDEKKRCTCHAK